ncbi:hypothetical protein EYM_02305 [Ignicoccus islandicus DSM 13165]|uniref:Ni/Fe hydrogenase subunit alpha n=1 Tax=Ignicoccus islandicus DSM 13165 TaxID=940295 RepID=A0A0U3FKD0_9CREN|nr:nickel-dependent hydrogenase large subunit [Ignicoccus islandicus]ALU12310.1 hypothetical protein EYM_02305 [Ignicoccus islandicus DSM 13165]
MNATGKLGTHKADELLELFREEYDRPLRPLFYHHARVIETVHMFELLKELMDNPELYEGEYLAEPDGMRLERGVGGLEAPRGVLFHDVRAVEDNGTVRVAKFNIITPTALNAAAMEADLRAYLIGKNVKALGDQGLYAAVSSIIRSYDPCMACATHSVNRIGGFKIAIVKNGKEVKTISL